MRSRMNDMLSYHSFACMTEGNPFIRASFEFSSFLKYIFVNIEFLPKTFSSPDCIKSEENLFSGRENFKIHIFHGKIRLMSQEL